MTVTYTHEVRDCKGLGCFWKLLFRWRGSIYKLVWPDLISYTTLYFILSLIYRLGLDEEGKKIFEMVALYCQNFSNLIPLSFVLGFFVNIVFQRWWDQYLLLPWPDSLSLFSSAAIQGQDDRSRMMRRTIVRYANLAFILTLRKVCVKVKKRFPTYEHLVEAGLLEVNERDIFEKVEAKTSHLFYWMPLVWAGAIVSRARKEKKIRDDFAVKTIIDEINRLRGNLGRLLSYDTISIPLVYTQVVTLAVYTFFLSTLMGRQFLDPKKKYDQHTVDYYVPIFSYLQFFFYMGWLKVAESLINPFGEDDDDFEVNWLIDRNVQISYMIVDEMHNDHPNMIQDMYWDEVFPAELPYTVASEGYRKEPPMCSTDYFEVPKEDAELIPKTDENASVIEHNDCESQLSGAKRTEMFHKRSVMLTNAIKIWKNFAPSIAGGIQSQTSIDENDKTIGSVDIPDNGLMSSQSSEISDDSDRVHSRETLICTRNKSGSPACCKKSNISEPSMSLQSPKTQNSTTELEGKVNTVFFIHPAPPKSIDSRNENSSERPKLSPKTIPTDTSITSYTPDEEESQSQLNSRYFPVYDKPTKYLQENVSKGMQIQNRNSKDKFPSTQKDHDEDSETSRQSLDKEPKNENAIEFWF